MSKEELFAKIYGSLAGVAIGDALGFPVHDLSKEEIKKRYGGLVDRMMPAFADDFIQGPGTSRRRNKNQQRRIANRAL